MTKYTLKIDGMQCGMCESHINDVVRKNFPIKKVQSSHSKNQTVILTENELEEQQLKEVITATGYTVLSITSEPYEKRGFFSGFHK